MTATLNRRAMMAAVGSAAVAFAATQSAFSQIPSKMPPAPKPEDWIKSPAIQSPSLSPDGLHTLYFTEADGVKYLVSFDVANKKPGKINIGDVDVVSVSWIDNRYVLVVTEVPSRRIGNTMGPGSFEIASVYDLTGNSQFRLYDKVPNFGGISNGDYNVIQKDGKTQITASATRSDLDGFAYFYSFELDGKKQTLLDRAPEETQGWVVTENGTLVGRSAYYGNVRRDWTLEYYNGSAWKEIYRTHVTRHAPTLMGLGRDGKTLVVRMPTDGDVYDYVEIAADGTISAPLVSDGYNHTPIFHPHTYKLVGFGLRDDWYSYEFFDQPLKELATKAQAATEGYRMLIEDYCDDAKKVIIYSEGIDDAGTYYYIDFNTGFTMEIGQCYPNIAPEWFSDKQPFAYTAADGTTIHAYLALPPGKANKDLPLVVIPHNGLTGRDGLDVSSFVEMFTTSGYAVLSPNFRGSGGYGQAFIAAGYGQWGGGKRVTDVSDGVRALAAQGTIDSKRVCIVGEGWGAYMAMAGVAFENGIYNCAVNIAGVVDIPAIMAMASATSNGAQSPGYVNFLKQFGVGTDFASISPTQHVSAINVPVLVLHSQNDPSVQYQQSEHLVSALNGAGKSVEFSKYDFTQYWQVKEAWRLEILGTALGFVKKHNPV